MQLLTALAVVAAVGLVTADYNTVKVADKEFLLKQKKIYNLLYHISQPSLVNPTLYEEGRSYKIEANIDSYTNTVNTSCVGNYNNGSEMILLLFFFFFY